jgi:hypothetical protein
VVSLPGAILAESMPAFYRASVLEFLNISESELTGLLTAAYAGSGFAVQRTSQTLTWIADVSRLRRVLEIVVSQAVEANGWTVLLEFPIPRKEKRIDLVLLTGQTICVLELKSSEQGRESIQQAEEYALLLHYFHEPSNRRKIVTFVVAPNTRHAPRKSQMFLPILEAPAYWISRAESIDWEDLSDRLLTLKEDKFTHAIDPVAWDNGNYHPVPTIIEAAQSLQSGLSIREIAHSRAARHDVDRLTDFVHSLIDESRTNSSFAICFITGVPGSGKTLVGLNLAFSKQPSREPIHFMSGTGPLVMVLQAVLARHHQLTEGATSSTARMHAKTLIENVHVFAKHYSDEAPSAVPSNHVIIFDEAQRAWDKAQNLSKFKRDYSEPEMLLNIMGRHQDWAVVVALVGGGQEINNGEAGLGEWGRALASTGKSWNVYASPEALEGGAAVAGSKLLSGIEGESLNLQRSPQLHLDVSVRSLKADAYSAWVNFVVSGDAKSAAALQIGTAFPIFVTRSLADTRRLLLENTRGQARCGLVGSSAAARIRGEGLEPDSSLHGDYPWDHWFLAGHTDVRSSYQMEVFAAEFEIQGLELDWIGLCWGGDYVWSKTRGTWLTRAFRHGKVSKWSENMKANKRIYRQNAYRVLLTRARQGIVIFVPAGDSNDPTRVPMEFDETAEFLLACGARSATLSEANGSA